MNEHTHGIQVVLRAKPANRRELVQGLEEISERMRSCNSSVIVEVCEDLLETGRVTWTEWWRDDTDLTKERASERFRTLLGAARTLGQLESIHEIERKRIQSGATDALNS